MSCGTTLRRITATGTGPPDRADARAMSKIQYHGSDLQRQGTVPGRLAEATAPTAPVRTHGVIEDGRYGH